MLRTLPRAGLLVAPCLILMQAIYASDMPQMSFNQMTDDSELVVSGTVTRTWTGWDPDHKYIWTHYELTVSSAEKGSAGTTVDIAEPGGELDGLGMIVSGAAGYAVGEKVLVFLSRMPNGFLRTAGLGQGKYLVDPAGRVHGQTTFKTDSTGAIRSLDGMSVSQVGQLVSARIRMIGGGK